jgi:uncharacterized repeat protein (TIGR03803 family)
MRHDRNGGLLCGLLAITAVAAAPLPLAGAGGGLDVIHSFGDGDGEYPATDLVVDSSGTIYGTTTQGGGLNSGTVFALTPSGQGWSESVIYSFTSGEDGGQPYNGVTLDTQGNLYGTAVTGGMGQACEGGCGVVYKLTRNAGTWTQSVLHNFTGGDDGSGPGAGLTFDGYGNLYGMTPTGGAFGLGVIYKLRPDGNGGWTQSVVHAFTGGTDGAAGSAGRLLLHGGRLYGVTTVGGAFGKGTVFRLTPHSDGGWSLETLYSFKGPPDGGLPYGAVVRDTAGRLYGTTYYDGAYGLGAVYQLAQDPSGQWRERVIHSFEGGGDGSNPVSHLNVDAAGNLYGTTSEGGDGGCNCGTIFKLTDMGAGHWQHTVLHTFAGSPDGKYSYNGMARGPGGKLYGATVLGGDDDDGVIFAFKP